VHVLQAGYAREADGVEHVGSTVTLILDGDAVIVVDPGMVEARAALLAALTAHGPAPADVTDVVFSHHHPDHTVNAALFPPRGSTTTGPATRATSGPAGTPKARR
jgi:glyoxylase-like metal-dependent hydrolase (beta-lactamase superfamily II)